MSDTEEGIGDVSTFEKPPVDAQTLDTLANIIDRLFFDSTPNYRTLADSFTIYYDEDFRRELYTKLKAKGTARIVAELIETDAMLSLLVNMYGLITDALEESLKSPGE